MELIQDAQNKQKVRQALQLVALLPIVWPTETDCARALSDFTVYHLSNNVGLIDALIAACAVGRNATLCTFNIKHLGGAENSKGAESFREQLPWQTQCECS